jgi:hypothetical protein
MIGQMRVASEANAITAALVLLKTLSLDGVIIPVTPFSPRRRPAVSSSRAVATTFSPLRAISQR